MLEPTGDRDTLGTMEDKVGTVSWASGIFPLTAPFDLLFAPCTALFCCPWAVCQAPFSAALPGTGPGQGGGRGALDKYWKRDNSLSPVPVLSSACSHPLLYLILKQPWEASRTGVLALVL